MTFVKNRRGSDQIAFNRIAFDLVTDSGQTDLSDFRPGLSLIWDVDLNFSTLLTGTRNIFMGQGAEFSFQDSLDNSDKSLYVEYNASGESELRVSYSSSLSGLVVILTQVDGVVSISGSTFDEVDTYLWKIIDGVGEPGYSRKLRLTVVSGSIYLSVQKDGKWFVPFIAGVAGIQRAVFPMPVGPEDDLDYVYEYLSLEVNTFTINGSFSVKSSFDPIVYLDTPQLDTAPFCHFEADNGKALSFTCSDLAEGEHTLSYLNEEYLLYVTSNYDSRDYPILMPSSVANLICESGSVLICQDEAIAGADNIGNMTVYPMCCFEDGSLRDATPFDVAVSRSGYLTQQDDRTQLPDFLIREADGQTYGCNFEFQRIFKNEWAFEHQPIVMRQCKWSTGRRVFYGLTSQDTTLSGDISIDISFTHFSRDLTDFGIPGFFSDSAYVVKVIREDYEQIFTSGIIQDPVFSLSQILTLPGDPFGRFFIEISFFSFFESAGNEFFLFPIKGMRAQVEVYRGADLIEQATFEVLHDMFIDGYGYIPVAEPTDVGRTDAPYSSAFPFHTRNKLHFELMPLEADIVLAYYDPSTSSLSSYSSGEAVSPSVKLTKVLTKTRSISAIELSSGHICIFYRLKDSALENPFFDSFENNYINYDVVDIDTGVIVYGGRIEFESYLGDTHSLYAFEVVRENESVLIITSWRDMDNKVPRPSNQHPLITYPISPSSVDGSKVFSISWNTAFLTDTTRLSTATADFSLNDIIQAQRLLNADYYARVRGRNLDMKFALAGTMRAHYCDEMDLTVLSLVDNSSRQPLVLMGKAGRFKPVASPAFFNTNTYDVYTRSFRIDAVSSVIGHDGMIYGLATRGSWIQLGVIDPSIYWRANATLINAEQPYATRFGQEEEVDDIQYPNWTKKDFTDYFISILSDKTSEILSFMSGTIVQPVIVDLAMHQHYMTFSFGSEIPFPFQNENWYPLIAFQNGHLDSAPNETTCAFSWQPHYETASGSNYSISFQESSVSPSNLSNNSYAVLRNNNYDYAQLSPPDDIGDRLMLRYRLGSGYKFKARVRTLETAYTEAFVLVASATGFYDEYNWQEIRLGSLPLTEYDLVYGKVGFEISNNSVQPFEVTNYLFGGRTAIGNPIAIEQGTTYDLIIYMKQSERNLAQVTWLVKQPVDFDSTTYDFKNEVIGYTSKIVSLFRDVNQVEFGGEPYTSIEISSDGSYNLQQLEVYSLDLGLLRSESSSYFRTYFGKGDGLDSILVENIQPSDLGQWRQFNDERLLVYQGQPQYGFVIGYSDFNQASMSFHYYNGFTFTFGNLTAFSNDTWEVSRVTANPISSAHVSNLHGYWISDADNKTILIELENIDDGLFRIDAAVVSGSNFRTAALLEYDADLTEFTAIGVFDSTYCFVDVNEAVRQGDDGFLTIDHWLDLGRWSEEVKYISIGDSQPMKIIDVRGVSLKVKVPFVGSIPTGSAVIFGGNSFVKLTKPISAKQIFVLIPDQITYEGHYAVHTIDAGKVLDVSPDTVSEGFFSEQCVVNRDLIVGSQAFTQRETTSQSKSIELNYATHLLKTWMEITSLVESLSVSRIPVWVFRDMKFKRKDFNLALISSAPSYSLLLDDDSDESYQITIPLRAVE